MTSSPITDLLQADAIVDGRYRIVRPLGVGSRGAVYQASQNPPGRKVALKVIHSSLVGHPEVFGLRFFGEASRAARLTHRNSLRTHDYGSTPEGRFFLAMECVPGRSLSDRLWEEGAMATVDALQVASVVAGSLIEAHAHGCIHGQLSAHSVFVSARGSGFLKVAHYGQRLWVPEELHSRSFGSVGAVRARQMAPEQLRGETATRRSDVYGLGLLLHEMLTGDATFSHDDYTATLLAKLRGVDPLLEGLCVPPHVEYVLRRSVTPDPVGRYPDVPTMLGDLREALHNVRESGVSEPRYGLPTELIVDDADGASVA